jgi:hypothetical protein
VIYQARQQFLDEEGIALGPLDDDVSHGWRQLDAQELIEQLGRDRRRHRVEDEGVRGPGGSALEQLGSPGREQEERPFHLCHERVQ